MICRGALHLTFPLENKFEEWFQAQIKFYGPSWEKLGVISQMLTLGKNVFTVNFKPQKMCTVVFIRVDVADGLHGVKTNRIQPLSLIVGDTLTIKYDLTVNMRR